MITSAEEFRSLCYNDDPESNLRVKTDEVSEEILLEVLDRFPELTASVIRNNYVTLRILTLLASNPDEKIRWWVATKRKLSKELFEQLSRDPDSSVRHNIAWNRKVPEHILHHLAQDTSDFVAEAARMRLAEMR